MKGLLWAVLGMFVFGLVLFTAGYIGSENNAAYFASACRADGELTAVRRGENAWVAYTVDGRRYEQSLDAYDSAMRVGQPVAVYYDAADPARIRTPYSDLAFFILRVIGLAFAGVAVLTALIGAWIASSRSRTLREGERVTARIVEIRPNCQITYAGSRHPNRLICRGLDPATGAEREYVSSNLFFDPAPRLTGDTVPVAVRGKRYRVDVDAALTPKA